MTLCSYNQFKIVLLFIPFSCWLLRSAILYITKLLNFSDKTAIGSSKRLQSFSVKNVTYWLFSHLVVRKNQSFFMFCARAARLYHKDCSFQNYQCQISKFLLDTL